MISKNKLIDLQQRCQATLELIKKELNKENLEETDFIILKKLNDNNILYIAFLSEIFNKEEKRHMVEEAYVSIIEEHCEFIESMIDA